MSLLDQLRNNIPSPAMTSARWISEYADAFLSGDHERCARMRREAPHHSFAARRAIVFAADQARTIANKTAAVNDARARLARARGNRFEEPGAALELEAAIVDLDRAKENVIPAFRWEAMDEALATKLMRIVTMDVG
jgi:hypothetical protein